MVSIHGGVWVGVGIFIWSYSHFFIEPRVEVSLSFFKIIAILFVLWGTIRLSSSMFRRKERQAQAGPPKRREEHHHHGSPHQSHGHVRNPHGSHHKTHQHIQPHKHPSHHANNQSFRACPRCHHPVPRTMHQCRHCGRNI